MNKMNIIKSILQDCKSRKQILLNNWHKHSSGGYVLGFLLFLWLGASITDIYLISKIFLKIFIPTFLGILICKGIEMWQADKYYNGILTEKQSFESDKDWIVGSVFVLLGVITGFLTR